MTKYDFEVTLKESDFSHTPQKIASENVGLNFTEEAISRLAELAFEVNDDTENIGARRLNTILEKLL